MMQVLIAHVTLTLFAIYMAYRLGYEVAKARWKEKYWEGYVDGYKKGSGLDE